MPVPLRTILTDECGYYATQIAGTDNVYYAVDWSRDVGASPISISNWECSDSNLVISDETVNGAVVSARFKSDVAGTYCVVNKISAGGGDLTLPMRIVVVPACACQP
jgi:hypothetical protein